MALSYVSSLLFPWLSCPWYFRRLLPNCFVECPWIWACPMFPHDWFQIMHPWQHYHRCEPCAADSRTPWGGLPPHFVGAHLVLLRLGLTIPGNSSPVSPFTLLGLWHSTPDFPSMRTSSLFWSGSDTL